MHTRLLEEHNYPTGLHEFLKFCGSDKNDRLKFNKTRTSSQISFQGKSQEKDGRQENCSAELKDK